MRYLTSATLLSIGLTACGSQPSTTTDSSGPLTLHGRVVTEENYVLPSADVLLVWHDFTQSGGSTRVITTARANVEAQMPWRFTLNVPSPPPDAVYVPDLEARWGTRMASASFTLVEPGAEIQTNSSGPGFIAFTHNYVLTYAEGNGELRGQLPDGGTGVITVAKGFSLVRQDTVHCADGYDQSCIDRNLAKGIPEARAKVDCAIRPMAITHPVGVPLDTELTLTVRDPDAPPGEDYVIPCP